MLQLAAAKYQETCHTCGWCRAQLQKAYLDQLGKIKGLMLAPKTALCAAVYTELADVENEINGAQH